MLIKGSQWLTPAATRALQRALRTREGSDNSTDDVFGYGGKVVIFIFLCGYLINMTADVFGAKFEDDKISLGLSSTNIVLTGIALVVGLLAASGKLFDDGNDVALKKHGMAALFFLVGYILHISGSILVATSSDDDAHANAVKVQQYLDLFKLMFYFFALFLVWSKRTIKTPPPPIPGSNYNYY